MTQILPADDLFAAGSPAYGGVATGFLPLYLGTRLSTSAISSIWNPNGRAFISRPMHGAYQTTDSLGIHDYNAAFHDSGTGSAAHVDSKSCTGQMFRAPFAADVVVTGTFEMRALLGNPLLADLAPRGVFARAQAGTLSGDGTSDPEINNPTCYFAAVYQKQSDSTLRLGIYKCVTGTFTLLASGESGAFSALDLKGLVTITLSVTGTALFATAKGFGSSITLRHPVGAGTITDASVAGAGRCGFFMGADREPTAGRKQVDLCHLIAVDEGATRKLQDEFRRLNLAAAKQTTTDAMGTVGSGYLTSAFFWDAATFDGSFVVSGKTYTGSKRLKRATAGLSFDHFASDDDVNSGRLVLSQRPADSLVSQHRSVMINMPNSPGATVGEVWAGIALRARQAQPLDQLTPAVAVNGAGPNFPGNGPASTSASGYLFHLRAVSGSQVIWSLRRLTASASANSASVHSPIATLTENFPFVGAFPGYNVPFEMDFEVFPRIEKDPLGHVQLVCKIDGAHLDMPLAASAITAGMLNPSAGVFVDNTGSRVKSNPGEGLIVANGFGTTGGASANIDPLFEDWLQLALTNAVVLDRDQASVVLAAEQVATGTALDAILAPDWPFEIEYRSHTVSNPFESGHRQTMPRYVDDNDALIRRTVYKFRKRGVKRTELDALRSHWNAHNGLEEAFNFTAPGDSAVKVHYVEDSLKHSMIEAGVWEVEFMLESLV